jgi:hypothetical protein
MRWSFPSPASGCICRVPSITKARSSTFGALPQPDCEWVGALDRHLAPFAFHRIRAGARDRARWRNCRADDRGAHIDEDVIAGNRPARARIATRVREHRGAKAVPTPVDEGRNVEISGRDFALARLLTRMFSDRAWLEGMGLRLDNLAEAGGARSHRRCQMNFYSRGRRTPCARRVLGSKVSGSY